MSHDEIENTHVNTQDLSPIDAIGYALGVALPASVETITARVARLLSSERQLQRASEQLLALQSDLSVERAQNAAGRRQLAAAESELDSLREVHIKVCTERDEASTRSDALVAEVTRAGRLASDTSAELRVALEDLEKARTARDDLAAKMDELLQQHHRQLVQVREERQLAIDAFAEFRERMFAILTPSASSPGFISTESLELLARGVKSAAESAERDALIEQRAAERIIGYVLSAVRRVP